MQAPYHLMIIQKGMSKQQIGLILMILMIQILRIIQIISFTLMNLQMANLPIRLPLIHFQMNLILMKQIRMIQIILSLQIKKMKKKKRVPAVFMKPVMTFLGQMKQYLKSVIKIINVKQMLDIIISKKKMNIQFILILSN